MNSSVNDKYKIAVAVLIGGKSERMGSPKENVVIPGDGRTFLERICDEADLTADRSVDITRQGRYLSIRAGQEISVAETDDTCADDAGAETRAVFRPGYTLVVDRYDGIGPLGGIASVLEQARTDGYDAVLVLACDMYRYDHTEMRDICEGYRGEDILFARTGNLQPLASIYSARALETIQAQIASGDYRIRDLSERVSNVGYYDSRHPEFYENRNTPF